MADTPLSLTTTLGFFYKESLPTLRSFLAAFFPNIVTTEQNQIQVDRYFRGRQRAYYRPLSGSSRILEFTNGNAQMYVPPAISLKTPVTEIDAQNITVGLTANAPQNEHLTAKYALIQEQQSIDIMAEMVLQAVNVMRTGTFNAVTEGGQNVGTFDYNRDASLSFSYNFTTGGGIDWIRQMYDALVDFRLPKSNITILAGQSIINAMESSDEFKEYVDTQHYIVTNTPQAGETALENAPVLGRVIRIKIPGTSYYATIWSFDQTYDAAGTETPFLPDDEAIMTSLNSVRTAAFAGVTIADKSNSTMRTFSGEMISDMFVENDPDGIFLRTQSRPLMIPGNINHICRVIGTNF